MKNIRLGWGLIALAWLTAACVMALGMQQAASEPVDVWGWLGYGVIALASLGALVIGALRVRPLLAVAAISSFFSPFLVVALSFFASYLAQCVMNGVA